ncbi:DUF262 domain-containing protein [Microcoleus sp. T2B6]|uniref:GmrSD restriction endonuclease domain-containing protein n=1 Tax=unclassified Microcoleus TaxID=2642155 RepID=UPI002FD2D5F1
MSDIFISQVIEKVLSGQIRIPTFQRGFVWDADKVAVLMDSLYKSYPIGSLLFWRTRSRLRFERDLGPFRLPDVDPDYPIDYVLDGQQRITSIFGVFQSQVDAFSQEVWTNVYFDYRANTNAQESQFAALDESEADPNRYFLLRNFFNTVAYRRATASLEDEILELLDKVQDVFRQTRIPIQMLSTDDKTIVAIVFERINRQGIELDTLQLLSAWTWSEEFDLQRKFEDLSLELEPFGFRDVGQDQDLLLRCCAAVLTGNVKTDTLINLNGAIVRDRFQEMANGLKGAIDFLRDNLKIFSLDNLPYSNFLVPLSVFFSSTGNSQFRYTDSQRRTILKWFWRTCFSRRYNSQPIKSMQSDVGEISKLKLGQPSNLATISDAFEVESSFFKDNKFRSKTVITKTFILLLAQKNPYSFVTGSPISLREVLREYNRNQFHHMYPRAFLRSANQDSYDDSCLANFCFLSTSDNNMISNSPPSLYRSVMPSLSMNEILEHAISPVSLFDDDFRVFVDERAELLAAEANRLVQ